MRLNPKFLPHTTNGEHYAISTGNIAFKGNIKNNETSVFIVECLKEDTTEKKIIDKILNEYSVTNRKLVENDVNNIIEKLHSIGAIKE